MSHVWKSLVKSSAIVLVIAGVVRAGTFDLFWTDAGNVFDFGRVERASLDGSLRETIFFAGADRPNGIALDGSLGQVYWTASVVP